MKGLLRQQRDRLIKLELARHKAYVDQLMRQMKDSLDNVLRTITALHCAEDEVEEESSSSSSSSSASSSLDVSSIEPPQEKTALVLVPDNDNDDEDDDEEEEDDDFIDDAPPKKTHRRSSSASNALQPEHVKRVRRTTSRYSPPPNDKAATKRERDEEDAAVTLTSANARATKSDRQELKAVDAQVDRYEHSVTLRQLCDASPWFRTRYGSGFEQIRSALGREGAHQMVAHSLFDSIANTSANVQFDPHPTSSTSTICCFCNTSRSCQELLVIDGEPWPIATNCADLARAITNFFAILRVGVSVDALDAAFLRVMEAHSGKSGAKRRR
jgi:hypothetical protein